MNQQEQNKPAKLHEALKQYLAFLEARGLTLRTEEIPIQEALGRVSASAAYGKRQRVNYPACEMILQSFLEIEPAMIAALLSGGAQRVSVLAKPRVGILFAGEIADANRTDSGAESTRNPSAALYCAMLSRWGVEGVSYHSVACEQGALQPALLRAARECDLVLVCADANGRDLFYAAGLGGEVCVDGIAIHPGEDTLLGAIGAAPVICASCDPAAGIVVLEELVKPVLDRLLMRERTIAESVCVKMGTAYVSAPEVREFVRARLGFDPEGSLCVLPIQADESGIETLSEADCILDVPVGCAGYAAGERAHVRLLKPIDRIARTIRIRGSYEPFLDEAADALRRTDIRAYVSREGADNARATEAANHSDQTARYIIDADNAQAIDAIRRGECHMSGIRLPNDTDSLSYIAQHIPEGGVALVEGVCIAKDNQTYDLLVSLDAMEHPQVRAFLRVLGSEDFLRRLDARGGYRYDKPGRIKKIWP